MSAAEYAGWRRYRTMHPPEGTELLLANLSCMMMIHMSGGKSSGHKPQDFAPWLVHLLGSQGEDKEAEEAAVEQQQIASRSMALAWAAKKA